MSEETNIALLQKIVEDQRQILMDVHGVEDVTTIPQLWTLCELAYFQTRLGNHLMRVIKQTRKYKGTTKAECAFRTTSRSCGLMISA
jgi:uncharacterized protein (UPF0218 family)